MRPWHDDDDGSYAPFSQFPLVRRIVRLIDRELVHRGLPQMLGKARRLQIELAFRDPVGERAVEVSKRTLHAQ